MDRPVVYWERMSKGIAAEDMACTLMIPTGTSLSCSL